MIIRKIEIPPAGVFQLHLPKGARVLRLTASKFSQHGHKFKDGFSVPFMWFLCDTDIKEIETRTFIRVEGRTQLSDVDAEKLRITELLFIGSATIPREDEDREEVTYFLFEDTNETTN